MNLVRHQRGDRASGTALFGQFGAHRRASLPSANASACARQLAIAEVLLRLAAAGGTDRQQEIDGRALRALMQQLEE